MLASQPDANDDANSTCKLHQRLPETPSTTCTDGEDGGLEAQAIRRSAEFGLADEHEQEDVQKMQGIRQKDKALAIREGFLGAVSVYVPARLLFGESFAEDAVDTLHSLFCSYWSQRLTRCCKSTGDSRLVALPESSKSNAQRFFARSIGYFFADACLVLAELLRGHKPHQWQGRLAHHIVQSAACMPAIFGGARQTRATCTYLSVAYLAEMSNVFLRTNNVLRRIGVAKFPACMNSNFLMLLVSFFFTRCLNFPICTALIWRHRQALPPAVFRLQFGFAFAGIGLNCEWFRRLLMIFLRMSRSREQAQLL
mmetsp:Transcript_74799/g.142352  ORF Transcript_74799/g.142352 Transcript_74799/m.142352 type:complete len:311 (+) Transcript_74799:88-1020(+)